ncbi:acyltransferase family protein [Gemmata sp. JC673]|uniref:Acyltransferase family protein n=1 Tax=Gemmata algarum TaxID=2975278 RepID=A0ABU5EV40_9BACT|nr:acyltransferase family protein [Gemmata algarum]MDY3557504.1 acyltransferase family protein [Gemmata algarum]
MSTPAPSDRYHALDSLRGFAMFLGVVLHAAISFMVNVPAFWPVRDPEPVPLADVFLIAVHDFRMQLFFVLAGFFGCLLYQRYGLVGMLKHRAKRVALPFVLALVFIVPTVQVTGLYSEIENVRAGAVRSPESVARGVAAKLVAANPEASAPQLILDYVLAGEAVARLPLVHLWFLYYLLLFTIAVAVLAPLLGRFTGTRLLLVTDAAFRRLIAGSGRVLVPAVLTFPLMLPMTWVVDTPSQWNPQWHIVGYYFAFFCFGWMLYRHRDLATAFGHRWRLHLLIANTVLLPLMLGLVVKGYEAERAGKDGVLAMKLAGYAVSVLYTWLMVAGLWGGFLHLFARERAWVRYLADSAYWCYLASITPIFVFQFLVRDWPAPGFLKCGLVTLATLAVLLLSYEYCVRYSVIGAILNGRKIRPKRSPVSSEPAATGAAA